MRRPLLVVAALFLLTLGIRLLGVYPPTLRHDPATIALQACRILDGERPIFWSGQAWMGAAGTYVEAALFWLFGKNSLVMSLYAWALSGLWIFLSLLLAWRFYGPRVTTYAAALWLIPTPALMYWSNQARNDFQVFFIATPAILLLTYDIVLRHRERKDIAARAIVLGFVCGFSFWQNMAIGPCLVVTFAVLALHLGRVFWKRFVWFYAPAWLLGVSPVIVYNLTKDLAVRGQGTFGSPRVIGKAVHDLLTNVLPYFWGMPPEERPGGLWGAAQYFFLAWTLVLFCVYLGTVYRKWRRREDLLADQLVLGLVVFHLLVPTVTHYGKSFATSGNPILFITNLYTLAFVIPAVVLARLPAAPRLLVALPFLIYVGNNAADTLSHAQSFFSALHDRGAAAIDRFPDLGNPLIGFLAEKKLTQGYLESAYEPELSLAGMHVVEFSRPFQDRVLEYSLRTDAAKEIFWVSHPGLPESFRMIGARFATGIAGITPVYYQFRKDPEPLSRIERFAVSVSSDLPDAPALSDRNVDTLWSLPRPIPETTVEFTFPEEEQVERITLLPRDYHSLPSHLIVQRSRDGATWETVDEWKEANVFFWSVRHPFLKTVKPRCELVISSPEPIRHLRIVIPAQRGACSFREVYLYRRDPAGRPALDLDDEVNAIAEAILPLKATHRIVGDHYFMSLFKLAGYDVEFIPNRAVDNCGRLNPFLGAPLPLDFSKPLALIVPASDSPAVAGRLESSRIAFKRQAFSRHDLYLTAPATIGARLYWSGFDLLQTGISPAGAGR